MHTQRCRSSSVLLGEKCNSCTEKEYGWSYWHLYSDLLGSKTNSSISIHRYSLQQLVLATTSVTWMPFDLCSSRAELTKNFQMLSLLVGELTGPPPPPLDEIRYVTIIGVAIKTSTIFSRLKSHFDYQLPGCFIQIVFRTSILLLFKLSDVCHFHLFPTRLLF